MDPRLSSLLFCTIKNIFDVRMLLDTAAAHWAAERRENSDLERMRENLDTHQSLVALQNWSKLSEKDRCFHMLVAECTKNPVGMRLMGELFDLFEVSSQQTLAMPGRALQSVAKHEQIFAAIAERSAVKASKAMREHLSSIMESLKHISGKEMRCIV